MATDVLLQRCRAIVGFADDAPCDGDALIGMLQRFRPQGEALDGLFDTLPMGAALHGRLRQLYSAAGNSARPGGGQDAYFIVRNPPALAPGRARALAQQWLDSMLALARETGFDELAEVLDPLPEVRVLQGIAPKQTKADLAEFPLYQAIKQQAAELSERLPVANQALELLRPAYYFAACDGMLRDYLLWPVYQPYSQLDDPFAPYFELWRHGAKLRAFADDSVDVYLPHDPLRH
jgi:hypothetical protein